MENKDNHGNQISGNSGTINIGSMNVTHHAPANQQASGNDDAWKITAQELVAKGQLKEALTETLRANNTDHVKNQVIQLLGRISKLEVETITGTMTKQDESIEFNQIRNGVVLLISNL